MIRVFISLRNGLIDLINIYFFIKITSIMGIKAKVFKNKANNQLTIILPRKKLKLKKKRVPKFIDIDKVEMEY